jgi:hypothetical protein
MTFAKGRWTRSVKQPDGRALRERNDNRWGGNAVVCRRQLKTDQSAATED